MRAYVINHNGSSNNLPLSSRQTSMGETIVIFIFKFD